MKPEEARKWAELYTAIADGKKWQVAVGPKLLWRDAYEHEDPRAWEVNFLRIKPEPQRVYVATWFDCGILRHIETDVADADGLRATYGKLNGFRIDVVERELP